MQNLNKKTLNLAKKILKTETKLNEEEIEFIIEILNQLALLLVEQQRNLVLKEIENKY